VNHLHLQEVTDDRPVDVPRRDGTLLERYGTTIALERGRLVAHHGATALALGPASTACESPSSCRGIHMLDVTETTVVTLDRAGDVRQHDLATGAISHPCPPNTQTFTIYNDGLRCGA
jgi:hypothetical protein